MINDALTKIKLLYVDDDGSNLLAFHAGFRRDYEIFTATSAPQAMEILNTQEIHVIISDQRMPKTTGSEFFSIIKTSHPNPTRILLTGFTDSASIINAINEGEVFRFLTKPWDDFQLKNAIKNAYDVYITKKELSDKILELEKTNQELNRFVYSTSHDLRSPLSSIMGILDLANQEKSVVDPNNYLGMIKNCVNRMDVFIHKIIEYYKSIRVDDVYEAIDFRKLLHDTISLCKMQNPKVFFDTQVFQTVAFTSDEFRLSVIINNLLSNAVKYQKQDETNPTVKINVKVNDENAVIVITDNGIGIIDEHVNNIFNMFFRSTDFINGLGIGLYIVKESLTRIGGDISVKSEFGKGTSFTLKVPNKKI